MKSTIVPTTVICLCLLMSPAYAVSSALLTPSDIIDSTALLSKIKSPDDPLYPYFNKGIRRLISSSIRFAVVSE